ncbi:right-handed parallel beta-helix repeat-containing protein [Pseudoroseomonas wenyumeiae]
MLLAGPASAPASAAGPIPGATCPAGAIPVRPGMSLQSAINAAPAGASFCIGAGEHRLQAAIPKDGQRFHGEPGALLNGSRLVTEFSREGRYWVAEGQVQRGEQRPEVICLPGREMLLSRGLLPRRRGAGACLAPAGCGAGPLLFDYRNNRVYFRDDPRGRKVEAAVAPYAFRGGARDVLVENLTIEKYAPPVQYGAVGYNRPSPGWIVRNNEIRLNYGLGVSVGSNTQVLENHIHGNGEMGAGCVGRDILFERNEIAFNGYFSGVEPNWEGGGGKCALTQRLVVRGNHLHHNNGYGFWTDIDNTGSLYEDNLVEDNLAGGLTHEISFSAVIRRNTLRRNGPVKPVWLWGAAILVQNSRDVEVYGNSVDMTGRGNGISLVQQDRGAYVTVNNHVHGNTLLSATPDHGASGALADHNPEGLRAGNNRFDGNLYRVRNPGDEHWAWVDGFRDWAEHRRRSGQDAGSRVEVLR